LRIHLDKGKARLDGDNETGAVLSMRRVQKMRLEQHRLLEAIGYLRNLEVEMEAYIQETSSTPKGGSPSLARRHSKTIVMPKVISFRHKLDRILLCDETASDAIATLPEDEVLLSELRLIAALR